jgi:hypothetical protein
MYEYYLQEYNGLGYIANQRKNDEYYLSYHTFRR